MTEINKKELLEFWEWCGFKSRLVWSDPADIVPRYQFKVWDYPDGSGVTQHLSVNPPLDLNNLFKYAVPKLHAWTIGSCPDGDICAVAVVGDNRGEHCGKDLALVLYQAIQKARKVSNDRDK